MKPVSISHKIILFLVFLSTILLLQSCKKDSLPVQITYTGNLLVASPITFHINPPAGSKVLWTFAYGDTSSEISPVHSFYYLNNSVSVSIMNNNDTQTLTKTITLKTGYEKLAGTHHWTGGMSYIYGPSLPVQLNDTTFDISESNDTLMVWGQKLYYQPGLLGYVIPVQPGFSPAGPPDNYGACFAVNNGFGSGYPLDYLYINYINTSDTIYFETVEWISHVQTFITYHSFH